MTASSRRDFIRGQWSPLRPTAEGHGGDGAEIASLIVNAWPQHLDSVAAELAKLPGVEVHARDAIGKLIVVIEAPTQGEVGALANTISLLDNVISAAMVFQASDVESA